MSSPSDSPLMCNSSPPDTLSPLLSFTVVASQSPSTAAPQQSRAALLSQANSDQQTTHAFPPSLALDASNDKDEHIESEAYDSRCFSPKQLRRRAASNSTPSPSTSSPHRRREECRARPPPQHAAQLDTIQHCPILRPSAKDFSNAPLYLSRVSEQYSRDYGMVMIVPPSSFTYPYSLLEANQNIEVRKQTVHKPESAHCQSSSDTASPSRSPTPSSQAAEPCAVPSAAAATTAAATATVSPLHATSQAAAPTQAAIQDYSSLCVKIISRDWKSMSVAQYVDQCSSSERYWSSFLKRRDDRSLSSSSSGGDVSGHESSAAIDSPRLSAAPSPSPSTSIASPRSTASNSSASNSARIHQFYDWLLSARKPTTYYASDVVMRSGYQRDTLEWQCRQQSDMPAAPLSVDKVAQSMLCPHCSSSSCQLVPIRSSWDLRHLALNERGLLHHLNAHIPGVTESMLYIGSLFSSFAFHNEDNYLSSISYHHRGASKVWYAVPGTCSQQFEELCSTLFQHDTESPLSYLPKKTTFFTPVLLQRAGIPVNYAVHQPNTFIVTFPQAYHAGFSTGFNVAESVNFALGDWLARPSLSAVQRFSYLLSSSSTLNSSTCSQAVGHGRLALERYRQLKPGYTTKFPVIPHEQLIINMITHLKDQYERIKHQIIAENKSNKLKTNQPQPSYNLLQRFSPSISLYYLLQLQSEFSYLLEDERHLRHEFTKDLTTIPLLSSRHLEQLQPAHYLSLYLRTYNTRDRDTESLHVTSNGEHDNIRDDINNLPDARKSQEHTINHHTPARNKSSSHSNLQSLHNLHCSTCKTTCTLSYFTCYCPLNADAAIFCLRHSNHKCFCGKTVLTYRFSTKELEDLASFLDSLIEAIAADMSMALHPSSQPSHHSNMITPAIYSQMSTSNNDFNNHNINLNMNMNMINHRHHSDAINNLSNNPDHRDDLTSFNPHSFSNAQPQHDMITPQSSTVNPHLALAISDQQFNNAVPAIAWSSPMVAANTPSFHPSAASSSVSSETHRASNKRKSFGDETNPSFQRSPGSIMSSIAPPVVAAIANAADIEKIPTPPSKQRRTRKLKRKDEPVYTAKDVSDTVVHSQSSHALPPDSNLNAPSTPLSNSSNGMVQSAFPMSSHHSDAHIHVKQEYGRAGSHIMQNHNQPASIASISTDMNHSMTSTGSAAPNNSYVQEPAINYSNELIQWRRHQMHKQHLCNMRIRQLQQSIIAQVEELERLKKLARTFDSILQQSFPSFPVESQMFDNSLPPQQSALPPSSHPSPPIHMRHHSHPDAASAVRTPANGYSMPPDSFYHHNQLAPSSFQRNEPQDNRMRGDNVNYAPQQQSQSYSNFNNNQRNSSFPMSNPNFNLPDSSQQPGSAPSFHTSASPSQLYQPVSDPAAFMSSGQQHADKHATISPLMHMKMQQQSASMANNSSNRPSPHMMDSRVSPAFDNSANSRTSPHEIYQPFYHPNMSSPALNTQSSSSSSFAAAPHMTSATQPPQHFTDTNLLNKTIRELESFVQRQRMEQHVMPPPSSSPSYDWNTSSSSMSAPAPSTTNVSGSFDAPYSSSMPSCDTTSSSFDAALPTMPAPSDGAQLDSLSLQRLRQLHQDHLLALQARRQHEYEHMTHGHNA